VRRLVGAGLTVRCGATRSTTAIHASFPSHSAAMMLTSCLGLRMTVAGIRSNAWDRVYRLHVMQKLSPEGSGRK